jgi:2-hydroxycyclohexanecarboxyl-CoA dehydrogenase
MPDIVDLKGRVLLVTGGGQGVGRRVALDAAEHGAGAVVITDFRLERAQQVAEEVEAQGTKALAVDGDASELEAATRAVARAHEAFGRVDILVNNAGNAGAEPTEEMSRPFWEQTPKEWQGYLGVNLYGVLNHAHEVLPGMIERKYGRIVTVISDAARFGEANREAYSAAKAGAAGFTRGLAATVGRYNITANSVSLGATRTPRNEATLTDDSELLKKMMKYYVLRRIGQPEDASNMILFLASDAASWITGQTYPVNGGYSFAL